MKSTISSLLNLAVKNSLIKLVVTSEILNSGKKKTSNTSIKITAKYVYFNRTTDKI